jgi:hypothetical protein
MMRAAARMLPSSILALTAAVMDADESSFSRGETTVSLLAVKRLSSVLFLSELATLWRRPALGGAFKTD